jgi:hypothetical protein
MHSWSKPQRCVVKITRGENFSLDQQRGDSRAGGAAPRHYIDTAVASK